MVIYRVEHVTNRQGPYSNGACDWERHYSNPLCPAPDEDGIYKWQFDKTFYGFKSKKDLVNWFGKEYIRQFEEKELYVYMYRGWDVSLGNKHLGFDMNSATRVRRVHKYELN